MVRVERILEVRRMARIAHRGHRLELAVGSVFVAGIAIDRRVRPGQGEAVIVLLDLLDRYSPAPHRVALLAIGAQLALVNVSMAVLAALADVVEHRLYVTLCAGYILVHAAQWITCLIVIKFRHGADRLPALRGVAVLTGNVESSVRAICSGAWVRPAGKRG